MQSLLALKDQGLLVRNISDGSWTVDLGLKVAKMVSINGHGLRNITTLVSKIK